MIHHSISTHGGSLGSTIAFAGITIAVLASFIWLAFHALRLEVPDLSSVGTTGATTGIGPPSTTGTTPAASVGSTTDTQSHAVQVRLPLQIARTQYAWVTVAESLTRDTAEAVCEALDEQFTECYPRGFDTRRVDAAACRYPLLSTADIEVVRAWEAKLTAAMRAIDSTPDSAHGVPATR